MTRVTGVPHGRDVPRATGSNACRGVERAARSAAAWTRASVSVPALRARITFRCHRPAAPIVDRKRDTVRAPAFSRDKIALAVLGECGGIKHGTVRIRTTPRVRAASTFHTQKTHAWRSRSRQVESGRRSESNQAGEYFLGPLSWFDFSTEGCCTGEGHTRKDHGGPQ